MVNPLPNDKILDWSKLKAFADDKINVSENLKFVLGRVENIVGKGENDGYQHFLFFPTMFSKRFFPRVVKSRDRVVKSYSFSKQALVFTCLQHKSFENTAGKGEIACNEQFLLYPQCFLPD